jgi:hypothetical protein
MLMLTPPKGTVCYSSSNNEFTNIGPPAEYIRALRASANGAARTKASNIVVTYTGFTPEARNAFQAAVDIWETVLETPVTIRISARWTQLGAGVLGSASPGRYVVNFDGAQKENVWYPIALAEKITGKELNSASDPDISASFSSSINWHYDLDTPPPAGEHDLISVVMHEIGHGLGITHAYSVEQGRGIIPSFFENQPVVYETNIEYADGRNLVNDFTPPSTELEDIMTSVNLLRYVSPLVNVASSGADVLVYAPATYNAGSSIAHLDENTYPAGNPNSLMTPFIASAERVLDPGPIVRAILNEMGWTGITLKHTPLKNSESTIGPYRAVVHVTSDGGYDESSVTINYKTNGSSFIPIVMSATGNANEFAAEFPLGSATYSYFVSVEADDGRLFTSPGKIIEPGSEPQQKLHSFSVGPDTEAPIINHTPKEFITQEEGLDLEAIVSDNLPIASVTIQWRIKGVPRPDEEMKLKPGTDSTYILKVGFTGLSLGDKIEYRIRAEDNSMAGNVSFKPSAATFYEVNITGLRETEESYSNNFDDLSAEDFFGNGFTVSKPTGFNNGAIHSEHPYQGGGASGANKNFIYNLAVPVRVHAENATLKFDEIVLVEPGQSGAPWPDANFFDYVVVEGSTDGGETWKEIADGYDSRFNPEWFSLWSTTVSNDNSSGVGIPALYKTHSFDLLKNFKAGDEVAFRFRLFSDPFSVGWGWSIDNLKIQIDDVPSQILHQHVDFLLAGTSSFDIVTKVTDGTGVSKIFVDYNLNGGSQTSSEILVSPTAETYTQKIDLAALGIKAGDEFQYRIRAIDSIGNTGTYPSTGFIKTAIISLTSSIDQLVTAFTSSETATADFTWNFFTVEQPSGFTKKGMASTHPYPAGMDVDLVSEYSWMTKKPVKVNGSNPWIYYEDVAIVEYSGTAVKDYVVVEASKDGITWEQLVTPYAANATTQWKTIFDNASAGTQGVVEDHMIDITAGGKFKAGDLVLIRFRLHSDAATTGWGWFVTNLSIQGPITGVEPTLAGTEITAWPNPVTGGTLHLTIALPEASDVNVEILSPQGQLLTAERFSAPAGDLQRDYQVSEWPQGFYVVKVRSAFGTTIRKIVKLR